MRKKIASPVTLAILAGLTLMLSACLFAARPGTPASGPAPTTAGVVTTPTPPEPTGVTAHGVPLFISPAKTLLASQADPSERGGIPVFDHVIVILFENHGFKEVIGNTSLPNFNRLASQNVLLTQYQGVAHPSLPNYIALISGSTFGISSDCGNCFLNQVSLPDLLEASGRTWKTYQEGMPSPCYVGFTGQYDMNHDPFLYFDPIRKDTARCQRSVVPLSDLSADLAANQLPNFAFIEPDLCNSAHSCDLSKADAWLGAMVNTLQSSPALGEKSMIFVAFDEDSIEKSPCCGPAGEKGGRVAAILISPQAKTGFEDTTALSHYGLLKTILLSWGLPPLGNTANPAVLPITAPWK